MTTTSHSKSKLNRVVMVSGGIASFEAARRVIDRYGKKNVHLWFSDTLIEDGDLYRFLDDIEKRLGHPIKRMSEGRNPWQVFEDERFIGNSRADPCSKLLKRQFLLEQLKLHFGNDRVIVYLGFDWSEPHRIASAKRLWEANGYDVDFPLAWEPYLFPEQFIDLVKGYDIVPPRLYELGFPHNNCGGACVKAGQKQWALLWEKFPERYRWHEQQEQKLRKFLGKDVSILRDRRGGKTRPLTLRAFRLRLQRELHQTVAVNASIHESFSDDEWGACSCFAVLPNQELAFATGR